MYYKSIILSLFLFFISFSFMTVFSQTNKNEQRVAIFKNGAGFFFNPMTLTAEKEGEQKGKFIIKSLPEALFGTFWFYTNGKPINSLKSYESEEKTDSKKAGSLNEMLYANIEKNVEITLKYSTEKDSEVIGKIQDVNLKSEMLFLETTQPKVGFMVISMNEIKTLSFSQKPNTNYSPLKNQRIIEVEIDKATSQENVEMAYLQRGIGWLPSYLINLKDDKKAQIVLRAEVVNDAEDIKNATLSLVVGVPNFKYDKFVSPFVSNQTLESFLNQLNNSSRSNYGGQKIAMSNMIITQSANYQNDEIDVYGGGGNTDEIETQSQEDLFFYTKNGVSLPKGGRALYSLFNEEVDYKHIYEVELAQNNGYNVVYKQDNEQRNDVYHSLELKNSTNFPWTTGTAMVTQPRKNKEGSVNTTNDPQVLSQDMIKYTAKTSKSILRLTVAPDIMVKDNEQETERETNIKQKKLVYDLVTATATIEVKNYKDKEVNLKVSRTITGEMLKTDSNWETKKRLNYYAINPINDVIWEVKLGKGESKTITYSYQFYVRK
ncbi:hypothetical protein Fleli_1611 [Bernardetia litoralis DSM 6794]|uniref:DUF4139 domain-containing protein n=1 Tax=Bernardetia litoralis (strain ATCC 23117 / DSM 6794 / NBRC 15988 / NCIMB 1366 / Fx l1 / Sio-4) TaxID=880071 RepID=I4AJ94_BERLS|nr:hypothetical protein [Bernardetia litoralis]AFM04029.1 hypothetical protein Fleli_1611 [Bernardetia litoralis DSM 6794]